MKRNQPRKGEIPFVSYTSVRQPFSQISGKLYWKQVAVPHRNKRRSQLFCIVPAVLDNLQGEQPFKTNRHDKNTYSTELNPLTTGNPCLGTTYFILV